MKIRGLLAIATGLFLFANPLTTSAAEFYQGKTIHFIVGLAAGGGYDLAARIIGRHMGKHIPGNPTIVVENKTGAGSLVDANYIANDAAPDGLTVGIWNSAFVLYQALGDPAVKIHARKLGWIGAPTTGTPVCGIMGFTGLKTWKDIVDSKKDIILGATRAGSTYDDLPKLLNLLAGTHFKVITGYTGTATIKQAMLSHEVDGGCWTWESMRTTARAMLDATGDQKLIPFLIDHKWPDVDMKTVTLIPDVFKEPDKRAMYDAWGASYKFMRPFMVPPGTPADRLDVLRKAFAETMKDPDFLAEAKKSKFDVTYVSPEQIEEGVKKILALKPEMIEKLKFLIPTRKKSA